jgi:signal transduction histidine kinase/ActR/RegA family two-component response regulator
MPIYKALSKAKTGKTVFFRGGGISDNIAVLCFSIETQNSKMNYRVSGTSKDVNGVEKIFTLHFSCHNPTMIHEAMGAIAKYNYEQIAIVNIATNQINIIQYETNEVSILDYTKYSMDYCIHNIFKDDQEMFLHNVNPKIVEKELEESDSYEFVCRICEKDGGIGYGQTRFISYNQDKKICLMTRTDVTEIVLREDRDKNTELKEALNAAQAATQSKSQFLSRMSHEIRTPMNAIMGMTAIAKDNITDFLQVSECLNKIDLSSQYLLTLLNDILEMSSIESGGMEVKNEIFYFRDLINGISTIVEHAAQQNDIRYECVNHANIDGYYQGDSTRIQQIIVNIITNAIKFTPKQGRVRFTIDVKEKADNISMFCFTIADTGIGMSEEFMTQMFHPFVQEDGSNTSKYGGSGLGLTISKNLIKLMGGTIEVESTIAVGTTFNVKIPLKRAKTIHEVPDDLQNNQALSHKNSLKNCQILMAEDHPLNIMITKKLLEKMGMTVTVVENGKSAVDIFAKSKPGFYQAILMDIRMPVMDGLEAARAIRALKREDARNIPIIAMTANALNEDRQKTKEAGMNAHLAKPFKPEELFNILMEYINE